MSTNFVRMASCVILMAAVCEAALPVPPQQNTPWKQPSGNGVPDYLGSVAAKLFEVGLADPRGGSYRDVEIVFRHGEKETLETHAWVFSDEYAVCWDGLVYTVHKV